MIDFLEMPLNTKDIESERPLATAPQGVDDAVGVPRRKWFVAIVNHNTEKISAEKLNAAGFETYVAAQPELRVWKNGRRKKIDRVVIPSMVFIRCTEKERLEIVRQPYIFRFLTNKASEGQYSKAIATIPDAQIETLKFMLGHSPAPVEFVPHVYNKGDRVRVTRGKLMSVEGSVYTSSDGHSHLVVSLDILGCAMVTIDPIDIEPA